MIDLFLSLLQGCICLLKDRARVLCLNNLAASGRSNYHSASGPVRRSPVGVLYRLPFS